MSRHGESKWYTVTEARNLLGVAKDTLRKWSNTGKIRTIRTPGGHRRYDLSSIGKPSTEAGPKPVPETIQRRRVVYCRVSTPKQKGDLERQKAAMRLAYPDHEIISDIGSGINLRRRGFVSLVDAVCAGAIEQIVVAHRDRLCRFGFDLFEHLCERNGTRLVVEHHKETTPASDFVDDLLSIVHVFSSRYYGLRSYERAIEAVQEGADAPHSTTEGDPEAVVRGRKGRLQHSSRPIAPRDGTWTPRSKSARGSDDEQEHDTRDGVPSQDA